MTLIELGIVMGIVSLLLALVLGLARHVDAAVKIRRAQADLGEWHESLNRWFLQFGEYPHARIDTTVSSPVDGVHAVPFDSITLGSPDTYPLARLTNDTASSGCYVRFVRSDGSYTNITFRSFLVSSPSVTDPWGTPYIYLPSANARSYDLFSCGPNRKSAGIPTGTPAAPDLTLDDIHLEK
jgi:type II secretory pathway pseudopilin PulG